MVFTHAALGNLVFLVLAVVLAFWGDRRYGQAGVRGLWLEWVLLATLLAGAFAWASPAFYGADQMYLTPVWVPVPVLVCAASLHLLHRRHAPRFLRVSLAALLFFGLQTAVRAIA